MYHSQGLKQGQDQQPNFTFVINRCTKVSAIMQNQRAVL